MPEMKPKSLFYFLMKHLNIGGGRTEKFSGTEALISTSCETGSWGVVVVGGQKRPLAENQEAINFKYQLSVEAFGFALSQKAAGRRFSGNGKWNVTHVSTWERCCGKQRLTLTVQYHSLHRGLWPGTCVRAGYWRKLGFYTFALREKNIV